MTGADIADAVWDEVIVAKAKGVPISTRALYEAVDETLKEPCDYCGRKARRRWSTNCEGCGAP